MPTLTPAALTLRRTLQTLFDAQTVSLHHTTYSPPHPPTIGTLTVTLTQSISSILTSILRASPHLPQDAENFYANLHWVTTPPRCIEVFQSREGECTEVSEENVAALLGLVKKRGGVDEVVVRRMFGGLGAVSGDESPGGNDAALRRMREGVRGDDGENAGDLYERYARQERQSFSSVRSRSRGGRAGGGDKPGALPPAEMAPATRGGAPSAQIQDTSAPELPHSQVTQRQRTSEQQLSPPSIGQAVPTAAPRQPRDRGLQRQQTSTPQRSESRTGARGRGAELASGGQMLSASFARARRQREMEDRESHLWNEESDDRRRQRLDDEEGERRRLARRD